MTNLAQEVALLRFFNSQLRYPKPSLIISARYKEVLSSKLVPNPTGLNSLTGLASAAKGSGRAMRGRNTSFTSILADGKLDSSSSLPSRLAVGPIQ